MQNSIFDYVRSFFQYIRTDRTVNMVSMEYPKEWQIWYGLKGETVLDAGCGKGRLVKTLRDQGVNAIGIDTRLPFNLLRQTDRFILGSMEKTGLKSSSVDVIFSTYSLFSPQYEGNNRKLVTSVLKEFNRILKDEGRIRISPSDTKLIREIVATIPELHVMREAPFLGAIEIVTLAE